MKLDVIVQFRSQVFKFYFGIIFLLLHLKVTYSSKGDRSYVFGKCVQRCAQMNCTNIAAFSHHQPLHMKMLMWSCTDECTYQCMWVTVDAFARDGSQVPQFYGKWPFMRLAGIQEPASMIFSLLNALSHLAILYYRAKVPAAAPMYNIWQLMALVGSITWLCATVFHTRDTPVTEKLDYFSAFGLVLFNLFTLFCRIIGTHRARVLTVLACTLLAIYSYHTYYLAYVHFDYGYNMLVNILVGAINAVGWIVWCIYYRKTKAYSWKCASVMCGLNILLMLELGDFPPILWTFDAHAIWHAGTVPLNLLWYSFIIDDSLHDCALLKGDNLKKTV